MNWIELNWIELNWIELNWIESNRIESNRIESYWIKFILFYFILFYFILFHFNLFLTTNYTRCNCDFLDPYKYNIINIEWLIINKIICFNTEMNIVRMYRSSLETSEEVRTKIKTGSEQCCVLWWWWMSLSLTLSLSLSLSLTLSLSVSDWSDEGVWSPDILYTLKIKRIAIWRIVLSMNSYIPQKVL